MSWEARIEAQRKAAEKAQKKGDDDQKQWNDESRAKVNAANAAREAAAQAELNRLKETLSGQEIQRFIKSQEFKDAMSAIMRNAQPLLFEKLLGRGRDGNHPDFNIRTSESAIQNRYRFSISIKWAYKPDDPEWKCELFDAYIATTGDDEIECGIFEGPYSPSPDGPDYEPYDRYLGLDAFLNAIAQRVVNNHFASRQREIRSKYGV